MKEYIINESNQYEVEMSRYDELPELIRCKDCIIAPICIMYRNAQKDDGYCSWSERKKE